MAAGRSAGDAAWAALATASKASAVVAARRDLRLVDANASTTPERIPFMKRLPLLSGAVGSNRIGTARSAHDARHGKRTPKSGHMSLASERPNSRVIFRVNLIACQNIIATH